VYKASNLLELNIRKEIISGISSSSRNNGEEDTVKLISVFLTATSFSGAEFH
jgi:hypothetical protein